MCVGLNETALALVMTCEICNPRRHRADGGVPDGVQRHGYACHNRGRWVACVLGSNGPMNKVTTYVLINSRICGWSCAQGEILGKFT